MRGLVGRTGFGRCGAVLAVTAGMLLAGGPARAEDGGFFGFLSAALGGGGGGGGSPAPTVAPPTASESQQVRPLTVRRSPKRGPSSARAQMAKVPTKTGPVSIYEDRTLRDGDAVMTKSGMKVFAGGRFSPDHPYGETDFVAVSASKSVAPGLRKTVIDLNKLPHG